MSVKLPERVPSTKWFESKVDQKFVSPNVNGLECRYLPVFATRYKSSFDISDVVASSKSYVLPLAAIISSFTIMMK